MRSRPAAARLSALTAGIAATLCTAAPAPATEGYDRCPPGFYCLFSGLDGTGTMLELTRSTPDLATMNDRADSGWNRTASIVRLWSDPGYTGCTVVATADSGGKGNFQRSFRDFFSSVQFDGPVGPGCDKAPGDITTRR